VSTPSALDRPIALAELVDAAALDEVIKSYADFHGVAISVVDITGRILAQGGVPQDLCEAVRDRAAGKTRCEGKLREVRDLRPLLEAGAPARCDCFTGLRYQIAPLAHDGTLLGTLVFGPYLPEATNGRAAGLTGIVQSILGPAGLGEGEAAFSRLRTVGDPQARKILEHVARILGVLLHSAYARHLTAQLHIATLAETYDELADKNRRLASAVERMQEVDRLKSNFLATVSHELRTPLTSVIGYSEMLIEGLAGSLNPEQREYVQIIMEKGDQLLQLITGILDVSRMETGTLRVSREPVDLDEIIAGALVAMAPLAKRKRLEVRGSSAYAAPRALGDREKIRQIVFNLLGNAIKFTPDGGRVEVNVEVGPLARDDELTMFGSLSAVGLAAATGAAGASGAIPILPSVHGSTGPAGDTPSAGIRLRVVDSGIGIAPDKQSRIFEPFFQVDSSSTREYGGTGLGLTLVKHYVEAQGGRVWVDSELGRGSQFTVTIPAVDDDLARYTRLSRESAATSSPPAGEPSPDRVT
jgi:two-component system, NarL family, sensor histidine kinase BarA